MAVRSADPRSSRWSWPTNSPSDAGRIRAGSGWSDAGTLVCPRRSLPSSKSRSTSRFWQPDWRIRASRVPPMASALGPGDGNSVDLGGLGVRFMVGEAESGGGFALVEHPIAPRALAAPMHTHTREDEYSYVLEGEVGIQVGDEVLVGRPGDLVTKPRGIPHAF